MIHLLEVGPEIEPGQLKKLSRRLAMTGGYEITLRQDLEVNDLRELIDLHLPELAQYPSGTAEYCSNNSYRILELLLDCPELSVQERERVREYVQVGLE